MFYVPDQDYGLFNEKPSMRIIKKFNDLCGKYADDSKKESK